MKLAKQFLSVGRYRCSRVLPSILCMFFLCLVLSAQANAESKSSREYQVKSAMLYNFMKFIDWPEKSRSTSDADASKNRSGQPIPKLSDQEKDKIFIALVAEPDIYEFCQIIQGKKVKNKTIQIHRFSHEQVKDPHVLLPYDLVYITSPPKSASSFDVVAILEKMKHHRILTLGEIPKFLESGGMVNFVQKDSNVCFEINLDVMQKEGFVVKAQLLRLAKRVIKKSSK